jgi:hypothetical protein
MTSIEKRVRNGELRGRAHCWTPDGKADGQGKTHVKAVYRRCAHVGSVAKGNEAMARNSKSITDLWITALKDGTKIRKARYGQGKLLSSVRPLAIPFGATSTAAQILAGVDLASRQAVTTEASSGLGVETARALAASGAEVTLAVRVTTRGEQLAADILATTSTDVSYQDAEQGAATSALLAGSPLVEGMTRLYFEDCQQAGPHRSGVLRGVASRALDPDRAEQIWAVSSQLIDSAQRCHVAEGAT